MELLGAVGTLLRLAVNLATSDCAWFGAGGEVYLQILRVIKRRYVLVVHDSSMPNAPQNRGYATGARSGPLCQAALDGKWNICSTTHSLRIAGSGICSSEVI